MISSSCSYASSALAKTLFARGADFTAAMVFMVASTNLVVELGIVLWLLIGWQFALAEFVGGAIMIVLLGLVVPRLIPRGWIEEARDRLNTSPPSRARGRPARRSRRTRRDAGRRLEDGEPRSVSRCADGCAVARGLGRRVRLHDQRPDACCARNW